MTTANVEPRSMAYRDAFVADDEVGSVFSLSEEEEVVDLSVDDFGELAEQAELAQRLAVSRNARAYVRGSAVVADDAVGRPMTDEKLFRVSKLIDWHSGNPDVIVDELKKGRVRARVSAAMGLGKSTRLASYIADAMDHRVLHIGLEAGVLDQAAEYILKEGIGWVHRSWSVKNRSWVCFMTYADFNSNSSLSGRSDLMKHFETIILDESFVYNENVEATKRIFAVVADQTTNLLLCSATIRTDGQKVEAKGVGNFKLLEIPISPEEAIASGKLVTDYLVDRTITILPSDERIHAMAQYLNAEGVDVQVLDGAARHEERREVERWLQGDSSTPRVLVADPAYAIGYNFNVSFMILFPLRVSATLQGNEFVEREIPMAESMVAQAKSRTGRGIADESGGIVMSPDRTEETYLDDVQRFELFCLLQAAYIRPRRVSEWAGCYEICPKGLAPATARAILEVNLPAIVAVRFITESGSYSGRFSRGLTVFAQSDHFISDLDDAPPVHYDRWVEEPLFGCSSRTIKVPVHAKGELQIKLHAIVAMTMGMECIPRWRIPTSLKFHDGLDRVDEEESTGNIVHMKLRKVRSFEEKPLPVVPTNADIWAFNTMKVSTVVQGNKRQGGELDPGRFAEAVKQLKANMDDYRKPEIPIQYVQSPDGLVGCVDVSHGVIESPGGSVVCELPIKLCEALNGGAILSFEQFRQVIDAYRVHQGRFVGSILFDGFCNAWDSVLYTLMDKSIVKSLTKAGLATHTYSMVGYLANRFSAELRVALYNSNVFRSRWGRLFRRNPSLDDVMKAIRAGGFDSVAQSDAFISRVKNLKALIDNTLLGAENAGVFLPNHISEAQRSLPLHTKTVLGRVGDGNVVKIPKGVSEMTLSVSGLGIRGPGRSRKSSVNW